MIHKLKLASKSLRLLIPTAILLASANVYAQQAVTGPLLGYAEVPPVATEATAEAEIVILPDRSVSGGIQTQNIASTMAHIHEAPIGQNGPAIITLNQTASDHFAVPADAQLTNEQYASYVAGSLYINVHSAANPAGEIRKQLVYLPPKSH